MRWLLLLGWWLASTTLLAQGTDCRLKPQDIRPLLPPDPPGMYGYQWDAQAYRETARLPHNMRLDIVQHGCLRHHVSVRLIAPLANAPAAPTWTTGQLTQQLLAMLDLVYGTDPAYAEYRAELSAWLSTRAWPDGKWQRPVTVPVADRSFYVECTVGAETIVLRVETVRLLPAAPLRPEGIPAYLDDGWKPDAE